MPHSATYRGDEVEVNVSVLRETEDAYQFDIGRNLPVWITKSMISDFTRDGKDGKIVSIIVPVKIATEKGLV